MQQTKLIEFKNWENEVLRGILTIPDSAPKSGAIFLHGLERNATVEKKFRRMATVLAARGMASFRFDASGCGLSDGDFQKTTIAKRSQELLAAVDFFGKEFGFKKINFVAHSIGACLLATEINILMPMINKIIFIAPALNQKDLLRFYFVRDLMKIKKPELIICWDNYRQYLNEEEFKIAISNNDKMLKWNYIGPKYFLEVESLNFTHCFDEINGRVMHIHGDVDPKVPLESLSVEFPNRIIVKGGDHDLERPDMWQQWFPQAVGFLTK
jgi:pimeloyl-ACP methyl ester carboxylesterase